jgi:hypothetical protein
MWILNDNQNYWVLDFVHSLIYYKKLKNTTFRKLDLLPSSGEAKEGESGVKKPTQLGPLELASTTGPVTDVSEAGSASETSCF